MKASEFLFRAFVILGLATALLGIRIFLDCLAQRRRIRALKIAAAEATVDLSQSTPGPKGELGGEPVGPGVQRGESEVSS